jgi:class 3 adenylate cyclase
LRRAGQLWREVDAPYEAARIGAIAGAGEIVASASSIDGLDELKVSERRMVDLKGITGPVEVVRIDWA